MYDKKGQARAFYFNLGSIRDQAVREECISISKGASLLPSHQGEKKISKESEVNS